MSSNDRTDINLAKRQAEFIAGLPELGASFTASSTVRVPELRNVSISERVRRVIDHPAYQRLRKIRQLGPTHLVYPGAVHTRFEHSLGVFGCVQLYLRHLLATPSFAFSASEEDLLTVLAAGLLHDLGHYPFAHNLEALHFKGRDTPRHEEVGARILLGEVESLRGELPIGELLRTEWNVDPERVIALSTGKFPSKPTQMDQVIRSIISSAIDADKMDYLERDSIHLGVPYGRNYDRDRLLASLTLNGDETKIGVSSKGKVSAEIFIFGRYTMFSEAYWHHTNRSASAMLEAALSAFHSRSSLSGDELLEVLLAHDDDGLLGWLRANSPEQSATAYLLDNMRGNVRNLYKRVATYSRVYSEVEKQQAYDIMYGMDSSELYSLVDRIRVRLSSLVGRSLHPADIIIDTPPRDKDKLETIDVVYPNATGRKAYPLHELSRIVAGIQDDFMMVVKKIRIFAHPQLAAEIREIPELESILLTEILKKR